MPIYLRKSKNCDDDLLIYSPSLPPKPIQLDGTFHEYTQFSNVMTLDQFNQYVSLRIIDEIEHNTFLLENGTVIKQQKKTPGVKVFCACLKTTANVIKRLRRKGYSWVDIVQNYETIHTQSSPHKLKYNGSYYLNLPTLCDELQLDPEKLKRYQQKHPDQPLEKQIKMVLKQPNRQIADHLGTIHASKSKMCKHYNITTSAFNHRMLHNWSLEKALTTPVHQNQNKAIKDLAPTIDHKGIKYKSFSQMCQHYGLSTGVVRARLQHGNNLETALTKPLRAKSKLYETIYHNQTYRSINEILITHAINRSLYEKRLKKYPEQTLTEIIDGILNDRNN